ncbi:MAG: long-chain fatty acid--CoA ligase, partial [Proteobacteria bacterium]|nr:long-chain fatty acid--CoA ligase [Pseudomonadota bacterium]
MTHERADDTLPPPDRLVDIVRHGARRDPDSPAVTENDDRTVSYGALAAAVDEAMGALRRMGVGAGDRVVIVNENSIAVVVLLFAVSGLDAWPIPVNARLSAREVDAICAHARPRCVLCTTGVSDEAAAHGARFDAAPIEIEGAGQVTAAAYADPGDPEPVTGDRAQDVAVLIYTSGTTGSPKGVMLSHQAALFVASSPGSQSPPVPGDIAYCALPISHIYGLTSTTLRVLYSGGHLWMTSR